MKNKIAICTLDSKNRLKINCFKNLMIELDEEKMSTFAIYKKNRYEIQGNINLFYIIV